MQKIFRFTNNQDKILFNQFLNSPIESISREKTENKKMIEALRIIVNYPNEQARTEALKRDYDKLQEDYVILLRSVRAYFREGQKLKHLVK